MPTIDLVVRVASESDDAIASFYSRHGAILPKGVAFIVVERQGKVQALATVRTQMVVETFHVDEMIGAQRRSLLLAKHIVGFAKGQATAMQVHLDLDAVGKWQVLLDRFGFEALDRAVFLKDL